MIRFPTMPPNRQQWSPRSQVNAKPGMMPPPEKLPPGSSFGGQMLGPPQGIKPGLGSPNDKLPPMGGGFMGAKPAMSPGFGQMPQGPGGLQGFAPPAQGYDSAQGAPSMGADAGSLQGMLGGLGGMQSPQGMLPRGVMPNAGTRGPMASPQGFQGLGRFRGYQR